MPNSISTIRAQRTEQLAISGLELFGKAGKLDTSIGEQVHAVHRLEETWKGDAANAARGRAYTNIQHQHLLHEIMVAVATELQSGGVNLHNFKLTLLSWVDAIDDLFNVSDAGVVTVKPPYDTAPFVATAAVYTKVTQDFIISFNLADQALADKLNHIVTTGDVPGNDPQNPGSVDPDGFNNSQITFQQEMAGFGDPRDGTGGVVGNTDLSIMGTTPDGRLFTIQGDTTAGIGPGGGPNDHRQDNEGGRNNIVYWKMDDHGKWVQDEVVNTPFPAQGDDISTIPTSTFNVGETMYASVMNVDRWNKSGPERPKGESGWVTRSSELWQSSDGGRTWTKTEAAWENNDSYTNPFQVQSFTPADDGYVYMYGTQDGRTNDGLHVARVPEQYVGDTSKYQYWDGNSYSATQNAATSPPVIQTPPGVTGLGEPNVHFYQNKALVTFNDESGGVYTSSSTDGGVTWTTPTLVQHQGGAYGVFQSPFGGGDSISANLSLWNPYGTGLYDIRNEDTEGLGAY